MSAVGAQVRTKSTALRARFSKDGRAALGRNAGRIRLFPAVGLALAAGLVAAFAAYGFLRWITPIDEAKAAASIDVTRVALTVVAGVGGVVALVIAYRRQRDLEQSRFVERFGAAAAQLGATDVAVRIAGVYAMAGVADESDGLRRQQCIDVLCGYLRLPYSPELGGNHQTKRVQKRKIGDDTGEDEDHFEYRQNDREVRATIVRVIADHLRPEAECSWSNSDFDFRTAHLEYADFSNTTFAGTSRFDGTTFISNARFTEATFVGITRFSGATFTSSAWFGGATFTRTAWFDKVTFTDKASFAGIVTSVSDEGAPLTWSEVVTFNEDARFDEAVFTGDAWFSGATFSHTAEFSKVTFTGDAHFDAATFTGDAWFRRTTFSGVTGFCEVTFISVAWFTEVTFSSVTRFDKANFGPARFNRGTFNGVIRFIGVTFASDAMFEAVAFANQTVFTGADFGSERVSFTKPRQWGPPPPAFDWDTDSTSKPTNIEPLTWPPQLAAS
ncbi:pentapeptide repeat-containing protein [Nocardia beijingensis]|uniref:pentapeptide repeat-containing protein n=1 Tax=Nocardia beijingensis TaxID=95162 RepID=UPI0018930885|nr:pentapeptide repeat-containing protein [Nocardia beijingensis]MBF6074877.1 pentapeptide repeat-containing protein [Nocardia beijingensis]